MKNIRKWKTTAGIFLIIFGLTACKEVTADHVLQEPQAVDYETMTFEEILTAAIGCSDETSNEIADLMHAAGITEITGIERHDRSTEEVIGSWIIETDQARLKLAFGETEQDSSLVLYDWPDLSLTGNGNQEPHFVDSKDFRLFDQESDGIELVINDGKAPRAISVHNSDFLQPWVIFYQDGQLYYLNEIEIFVFDSDNKLASRSCSFVVKENQEGEISLEIDHETVPVTDEFRSFGRNEAGND